MRIRTTGIVHLANELVNKYDMYIAYAVRKQTPKNYKDYFDKRIHLIEVKNFGRAINPTKDIAAFFEVKKIAAEVKPDVIHLHSSKAGAIGRVAFNGKIPMFYKLIKKSLIEREGISFHEQFYCGEGFAFSVECFQSTNKVVVGHQNVYFYRIDNATSGSSTFSLGKYKSSVNAQDYMRNVLKDKSQYADNVLKFSKWRTLSDNFTLLKASGDEDRYPEIYHELKIEVKKGALGALKIPVKPKQKIRAFA